MSDAAPSRAAIPISAADDALFRAIDAAVSCTTSEDMVLALAQALQSYAGIDVHWRDQETTTDPLTGPGLLRLGHDPLRQQVLVATLPADLPQPRRTRLQWLAGLVDMQLHRLAETHHRLQSITRLDHAERLQRALFEIASLSDADHDLGRTLRAIHGVVGDLMYAENFYIALHDRQRDTIRFAYYADQSDTDPPPPDTHQPMDSIRDSVTWYLIRDGHALHGTMREIREQVSGELRPQGPEPVDWLGVPLIRDHEVVGGLVVQSYNAHARYTEQDHQLLAYVAQHVLTTLERQESRAELERRVKERTTALREANRALQKQVFERQRGEKLQATLFRIAELAHTTESIADFHAAVHREVGGLLYARNFYIAMLSDDGRKLDFPYSVDEIDDDRRQRSLGRGLTEYVLRHEQALLASRKRIENLKEAGELAPVGSDPHCWLGVPLRCEEKTVGVLAVQSYSHEYTYTRTDQELLTFVGYHIANALERKRNAESLRKAHAGLERRVNERTRALAQANRELHAQISERERIERRLKYETLHDALTGLPNRALLLQRLDQALQRYREDASRRFAVLFIDLDRFKVINDSVGHLVGDDLLFQVGSRIRGCVKKGDIVARLGGDEFAVLVENVSEEDAVYRIARRIIDKLNQPLHIGESELFTSASIGITLCASHYQRAEELLRDADAAMYSAKASGRRRAVWFDEHMRSAALSVLEIEGDLRRALGRSEFEPYFQPIVDMTSGGVLGYEALMRWRHPQHGLLLPGSFLGVAEDSGLIEAMDWQIFDKAFASAPELTRHGAFISINVSGRHLRIRDIDQRLLAKLQAHAISPATLRIEVTERTLLENPDQIKLTLQRLRGHGITIALDDFGTGYSSLSYLHQYPIQVLKIDRSFTARLAPGENPGQQQGHAIVRTIQALAETMCMQVIAEGVETHGQREQLLDLGCRIGQGYLYAPAAPLERWKGITRLDMDPAGGEASFQ